MHCPYWPHDNAPVPPGTWWEFAQRIKTQMVLPSADTAACIKSGDSPLNRLIGNEPQRTSSVVLDMGFDNTTEGKLVPEFKQVEGRFHREFILLRR
jgi:hypothetical protein